MDLLNKIKESNTSLQLRDRKVRLINLPKLIMALIYPVKVKYKSINLN
jgi:hypothetical protein